MVEFEGRGRPPADRTSVFLQLGLGIVLTFVLHALVGGALWAVGSLATAVLAASPLPRGGPLYTGVELVGTLGVFWLFTVGLSQVLYVGPAALAAAFVRRPIALGLLIGAALTFVLQSACYGLAAIFILPGLANLH